ncbi:MAG: rhodanese-like domain-containing protein [Planctomycetota bacterium]|nr:rhodanese-like domain-containing protein [Planctomycetota bacterium]
MNRNALILIISLGGLVLTTGCETPEPPKVESVTTSTSQPIEAKALQRAQINTMYERYRQEAFADVQDVHVDELMALDLKQPILFVDCREDYEKAISMIEGAVSKADFEADSDRYREYFVVAYCTIGYRSGIYAKTLQEQGFQTRNLIGGVLAWAHHGQPFVDADGNSTRRVHVYGEEWDLLPPTYESVYEGKSSP